MTVDHAERVRVAALALDLIREHEPPLEKWLRIEWRNRFTSRIGDARLRFGWIPKDWEARLRFSLALWPRAPREERDNTVAHEVAHLIVALRSKRGDYGKRRPKPHGREWQAVMRSMGYEPTRCHNVDNTGLVRRHAVWCHGCGTRYDVRPKVWREVVRLEKFRRVLSAARPFAVLRQGYACSTCSRTRGFSPLRDHAPTSIERILSGLAAHEVGEVVQQREGCAT